MQLGQQNRQAVASIDATSTINGVTLLATQDAGKGPPEELVALVVPSQVPGILWAFDNGARVFVGLSKPGPQSRLDNIATLVVVVSDDGTGFIAGECAARIAKSLGRVVGSELVYERLATVPGLIGEAFAEHFGLVR